MGCLKTTSYTEYQRLPRTNCRHASSTFAWFAIGSTLPTPFAIIKSLYTRSRALTHRAVKGAKSCFFLRCSCGPVRQGSRPAPGVGGPRSAAPPSISGTANMLPALLRPAAAFGGAGADKVALHVRQPAKNGNHQAAGAGAGVGPRLGE